MPKEEDKEYANYPHANCGCGPGYAPRYTLPLLSNSMGAARTPMVVQQFGCVAPQLGPYTQVAGFPAGAPVNSSQLAYAQYVNTNRQMLGPAWNGQMPGNYTKMSSIPTVQVPVGGLGLSGPAVVVGGNGAIGGVGGMGAGGAPVISPPGGWYWPGPQMPNRTPLDGGAVWDPALPMPTDRYYAQGGQTRPS